MGKAGWGSSGGGEWWLGMLEQVFGAELALVG